MNQIDTNLPAVKQIALSPLIAQGELVARGDADGTNPATAPSFFGRYGLVLLTVVVPMILAAIYLFFIASDRYLSETRFIVRTAAGNGVGPVTTMIRSEGLTRANDETYAVNDYLMSRDIVTLLTRNNSLREILARPEADFLYRFPNFYTRDNKENLFERYKYMASAGIDETTGISTVRVIAFRPGDAHAVASAILGYAEDLINRLNERAYDDAQRYAQQVVDQQSGRVSDIEARLTAFRNSSGTVDPGAEATASFELIGKMTAQLAVLEADLSQRETLAPQNPNIPAQRERIRSFQAEIDKQKSAIVGTSKSLASKLEGYEKLQLERELAARSLGLALLNLAKAREDAQQQHLYLQTIVVPNIADEREYPQRWLAMLIVFAISMAAYTISSASRSIMLDHRA